MGQPIVKVPFSEKREFYALLFFYSALVVPSPASTAVAYNRILMIPKHLPLTINKYNTTAVSAASKAQINITKSKILLSK